MIIFIHRICFVFARAVAILGVPIVVLIYGGQIHDMGHSFLSYGKLIGGMFVAILPILLLKYVIRVGCPKCGKKLDREVIGAGNYDCNACGHSIS